MSSTTRFPNGVTNVGEDTIFAALGQLAPTKFHTYWEDFDYYAAGDWTVTETQASATQALADGDGGLLLLSCNDREVPVETVLAAADVGARAAGREVKSLVELPLPPDITSKDAPKGRPMRGVLLTLR